MEEVLGQQPYFLNGPDTDEGDAARFREALAQDHDETLQTIQYTKDGTRLVVSLFLTALKDDYGRTLHHLLSWSDRTGQVEAEEEASALRTAGERQAFLLQLSDALRAEPNAEAMANRAVRMLSDQMRLDRCYVGIYRLAEDLADFPQQVHDDRLAPLPAQIHLSDFPESLRVAFDRTLVIDDIMETACFSDSDRASFSALGVRAVIAATLRKGEKNPLWAIVSGSMHPRVWTRGEIALVEEVAERTWAAIEQARAEVATREAEGRYLSLVSAIDQGFCTIELKFDEQQRAIDYRFLEISPHFEQQAGFAAEFGRWMREIAPDHDEHWFEIYGRVAMTGEPARFENYSTPLGRWWSVYAFKIEGENRIAVLFHDISDRKRNEQEIASREQQFETLLDQAPLGVYLVDSNFVIRQVNPVAMPVFGNIEAGPVGRDFDEIIHILWDKDYADEVSSIFRKALETGEPYIMPERAEHRSDRDSIEYYEWRVDRMILPDGGYGVVCYFRDISVQVQARLEVEKGREAARESEARLAAAFESVPAGVAVIDTTGMAVLANEHYRHFLPSGIIPSRDVERLARWRAWGQDGQQLAPQNFPAARALRGETVVPGQEMLYTGDDGREVWTTVSTSPIRDARGTVTGAVAVINDTDLAKRSLDALRKSEERFRLAIEGSKIAIYECDLDLRYAWITNPAPGLKVEDILGRTDHELLSAEDAEGLARF
jgi:PAS domain S-box-containing protein